MLVLSRKQDERILIGDSIEVKVLSVHGNHVRLGITCPENIRILRSEIAEKGFPRVGGADSLGEPLIALSLSH